MVFDETGSYIENKVTGCRTVMTERSGTYAFDMWVPAPVKKVQEVQKPQSAQVAKKVKTPASSASEQVTKGMFAALAEDSDSGEESDFVRQDSGLM